MTDDELARVGVRVHELWPGKISDVEMELWYRQLAPLACAHVQAALERHKVASKFPPTIREIVDLAQREQAAQAAAMEGRTASDQTRRYLRVQQDHDRRVQAERMQVRRELSAFPLGVRKRAIRQAVGRLCDSFPALSAKFKRDRSRDLLVRSEALVLARSMEER